MSNESDESDKKQIEKKAEIGYQTAIDLVGLVSHEIYSRFNAMLTANSIILAVIGWTITSKGLPPLLKLCLPIAGILLCGAWYLFVYHGAYWQERFRSEARRLETQYYSDTFTLISMVKTESSKSLPPEEKLGTPRWVRWFKFYNTSRFVITIFVVIYIVILYLIFSTPSSTRLI